ncbi:hypothetical protein F5884DRAFT_316749 [Xylogone sp. PMI_703]|nr:hypothetical protein F5884DRAFT_316749 [Xylogone sp. PMI_703]
MPRRHYRDDDVDDHVYEYDEYDYTARPRGRRDSREYDVHEEYIRYRSPTRSKSRSKSRAREALSDLKAGDFGGALATITRSRTRSRDVSPDYSSDYEYDVRTPPRERSPRRENKGKWQQAAEAALAAGVVEAFRVRKEPGPWTGEKGRRVATAALSAAAVDGLVDKNPRRKSKRHIAEAVIAGLAINRMANGPRHR